jgi:pimeloyl-ACP methyl ester carboxylesterase
VVYLEGGPGGSALFEVQSWAASGLRLTHDLILFDQRGTGYAQPTLNCPEANDESLDDPDFACYERLRAEGVPLALFNTRQSAGDVAALIEAFGGRAHLYGISYGTRLALAVMRDYGDLLESVVIDGVYPPNVKGWDEQAVNFNTAWRALMDNCSADPACDAAYPNLEARVLSALEALEDAPATVSDPETGEESTLYGTTVLDALFQALYDSSMAPILPAALNAIAEGDYETYQDYMTFGPPEELVPETPSFTPEAPGFLLPKTDAEKVAEAQWFYEQMGEDELAELEFLVDEGDVQALADFLDFLDVWDDSPAYFVAVAEGVLIDYGVLVGDLETYDDNSEAFYNAVECHEEIIENDFDQIRVLGEASGLPELLILSIEEGEGQFDICAYFDSGRAAPSANEPVISNIPTLVLSGEYDPITPYAWGQAAADFLPNSLHLLIPATGHGVLDTYPCPNQIIADFLTGGLTAVDASCVGAMRVEHIIP